MSIGTKRVGGYAKVTIVLSGYELALIDELQRLGVALDGPTVSVSRESYIAYAVRVGASVLMSQAQNEPEVRLLYQKERALFLDLFDLESAAAKNNE